MNSGSNTSQDARVDVHARGVWERQRSAFFDIRVCHPNAQSYQQLTPKQIYRMHEDEKKRMYYQTNVLSFDSKDCKSVFFKIIIINSIITITITDDSAERGRCDLGENLSTCLLKRAKFVKICKQSTQ